MIIECQRCQTRFQLDSTIIPPQGARVRCSRCQHRFHVDPPGSAASTAGSTRGSPRAEGSSERGETLPRQDNATTLQPRSGSSDEPDLENPEFIYDAKRQPSADGRDSLESETFESPSERPAPALGESLQPPYAGADFDASHEMETPYDGRSLSQLDPAGLDLSADYEAETSGRAEPPPAPRTAIASPGAKRSENALEGPDPVISPAQDLMDSPSIRPSGASPSFEARSPRGGDDLGGSLEPAVSMPAEEPRSTARPSEARQSDEGNRIEYVSRSGRRPEVRESAETVEVQSPFTGFRIHPVDPGADLWERRLRPIGLATGALLGLLIPLSLISGLLAPSATPPDAAAAGWTAREVEAFHATRADGGVGLVVQGRLVGAGSVPDLRLVLRDAQGVAIDVHTELRAGRLRPFDLESALARAPDTTEAAARAGGFTLVVPALSARARRYSIRLDPSGGA